MARGLNLTNEQAQSWLMLIRILAGVQQRRAEAAKTKPSSGLRM